MTAPLSQDLRERIVRVVEGGSTIRQAARRFAVSASAAIKLMQRVRQTGSAAPAKIGGYRRPLLDKHADALRAIVSSKAGITLKEMRDALHTRGIVVKALSTMPGLPEMRARLLGLLQAPATRLVRLLGTPATQLVRVLQAHQDREEGK